MHRPIVVVYRATGALHDHLGDNITFNSGSDGGSDSMQLCRHRSSQRVQRLRLRWRLRCLFALRLESLLLLLLLAAALALAALPHRALGATLADTCAKSCGRFETCIVYNGNEFCAQQCAPGRCDDATEACVLQGVECSQAPCLPHAVCEPKSETLAVTAADAAAANASSACARSCALIDAPVCASNGVSYANACIFEEAQCHSPGLTLIARGLCDADIAFNVAYSHGSSNSSSSSNASADASAGSDACAAIVCADVADPVCATSGTLLNVCALRRAQCRDANVQLLHRGACTLAAPLPHCPTSCTRAFEPVCASTGALFANECAFRMAKCARPFAVGFEARDVADCERDGSDSTSIGQDVRTALVAALS